jgi:uncharacterized membrane protein YgdD (TMEM256/DUF423 family)
VSSTKLAKHIKTINQYLVAYSPALLYVNVCINAVEKRWDATTDVKLVSLRMLIVKEDGM